MLLKNRFSLQGKVISTKMDKTLVVLVETYRKHPKYGKRIKYSKKYFVHDEENKARNGDIVTIVSTRQISKNKKFRLFSINNKNLINTKE